MLYYYLFCTLVSIALYYWLYITDVKKSLGQNIMLLIMIFSNLGYVSICLADSLETAILAHKLVYLGGIFLPMLYFLTVCEICHVDVKRSVVVCLLSMQIALYMCVCTIGFSNLYYKDVDFILVDGIGRLDHKVYGPTHFLYPLTMSLYFVASITVAIRSGIRKKNVNRKEIKYMLITCAIAISCYLVYRLTSFEMDIMAAAYLILMAGALVPIYHSNLYTAEENRFIVEEQLGQIGFVTFNRKMEYMGCNEYASTIFEELQDCKVGNAIANPGEQLAIVIRSVEEYHRKLEKRRGHSHKSFHAFSVHDKSYDIEIHTVDNFRGTCMGYTVELMDETEHYRMLSLTEKYNEELSSEVQKKTEQIRTIQEKTILGMAQMVESRDLSTGGHIRRTSDVVRIFAERLLAEQMGFTEEFLNLVIRSAPMHDLGKIGVDDKVLRKQGKFDDDEFAMMKTHAAIGGKMVSDILTDVEDDEFVRIAHNVANYHHEKVNGRGYPEGLKGDEIPVEARIMALADVFDALVSKRCYKEAFSYDQAFEIIETDSGTHFDAKLAEVFMRCRPQLEAYYNEH